MEELHTLFRLLLLTCILCGTAWSKSDKYLEEEEEERGKEDQASRLKNAVKNLLGFQQLPEGSRYPALSDDEAPKYMMELYEQYKSGRIQNGKVVANTVRGIHSEIGLVKSDAMFIFNLSSVSEKEKVLSSEIHVHKKIPKTHPQQNLSMNEDDHSSENIVAQLFELGPAFIKELGVQQLSPGSKGWQAIQVSSAINDCLKRRASADKKALLFAITFAHQNAEGRVSNLPLKRVMRVFSRPLLVVFSNDTQNITTDHVSPHYNAPSMNTGSADPYKNTFIHPATGRRESFGSRTHDKKTHRKGRGREKHRRRGKERKERMDIMNVDDDIFLDADGVTNDVDSSLFKAAYGHKDTGESYRDKRSIYDNELPEEPFHNAISNIGRHHPTKSSSNIPKTHPTILQGRVTSRLKVSSGDTAPEKSLSRSSNSKLIPYPEDWENSRLLPYPGDYKRRRRRRKNRRNNGRKHHKKHANKLSQRQLPLPEEYWESKYNVIDNVARAIPSSPACGRRSLNVDFADIGWSDWIISPKSFEANYCAGTCSFPLSEGLKPSNHATIQSILEAIGINPDVPAPCCVPDVMSSLTLLFFDENRNVVLKNYPGMTVVSCACR